MRVRERRSAVPVPKSKSKGWLAQWNGLPLYVRIVIAMVLGLVTGLVLGERALPFEIPSKVILQLLGALAPPHWDIAVSIAHHRPNETRLPWPTHHAPGSPS